jgi:hypothetical protein
MLRITLAALALTCVLTSVGNAGDCFSCGGSGGYSAAAWDGYCGCGGGGGCGTGCGGCNSCRRHCFPILHGCLHKIGCVVDALIPDPCCCRRQTRCCGGAVGCAQPTCGIEPACGVSGVADPFIDDQAAPPMPTPMPEKGARRSIYGAPKMSTRPAPAPRPVSAPAVAPKASMKTASAKGKSVLKVAYEDEAVDASTEDNDAPPAVPASIRRATELPIPVRMAAKPITRGDETVNPLR